MNLHAIQPRSVANGPGVRFVIWFQGCSLGCPGCFNPETHRTEPNRVSSEQRILELIEADRHEIEGVTFTGGEPFDQPLALAALVRGLRERTQLSLLAFSGYTIEEIRRHPQGNEILDRLDVLIDGRYAKARRTTGGLRGSSNQRIQLLSNRYELADLESTPTAEVIIDPQGRISVTGIDPPLRITDHR